jgi:hypothetical protein
LKWFPLGAVRKKLPKQDGKNGTVFWKTASERRSVIDPWDRCSATSTIIEVGAIYSPVTRSIDCESTEGLPRRHQLDGVNIKVRKRSTNFKLAAIS